MMASKGIENKNGNFFKNLVVVVVDDDDHCNRKWLKRIGLWLNFFFFSFVKIKFLNSIDLNLKYFNESKKKNKTIQNSYEETLECHSFQSNFFHSIHFNFSSEKNRCNRIYSYGRTHPLPSPVNIRDGTIGF